jgi:lysozyme
MITKNCIDLIKKYEGFEAKAYPDPGTGAEPITIGYGSTRYANGDKVKLGDVVTLQEAERLLIIDLERRYKAIQAWLPDKINQNQVDAVLSFVYNCGIGAFEKSTMRKKIYRNPFDQTIRNEFMRWVRAGGKVMKGLVNRRKAEADLYFKPMQ